MAKYIVLSVNDNPDYLYFTPLVCWAWRKIGWEPIIMAEVGVLSKPYIDLALKESIRLKKPEDYRSDTITQISRLYASCIPNLQDDDYLMTGDIDMIPLSDYWKPHEEITVWGHDLTGYGHYPICYIGMQAQKWREVMQITHSDYNHYIKRDLDSMPDAKSQDFNKYWFTDQELITKRLKPFNPTVINRGQYPNGYARGRVDRGAWTLDHKEFIDAHLQHQIYHKGNEWKFAQTMELLCKVWPDEDWCWFEEYTNEFRKLTGHE
jgi:hypothetical protein